MDVRTDPQVIEVDTMRGHQLIPPAEELAALPRLYSTDDTPTPDKVMHLHFSVGSCDWWAAEADLDGRCYGFVNLGDLSVAEWGYFEMVELATTKTPLPIHIIEGESRARLRRLVAVVERDLDWTPTRFADIEGTGR